MLRSFAILVVVLSSGCRGPLVVEQIGAMRAVMRDGQTEARVSLQQAAKPGAIAVGALEGLGGEITMVDGEVWVTRAADGGGVRTSGPAVGAGDAATLLTLAFVSDWQDVAIDHPIEADELENVIRQIAVRRGLRPDQPFPFVLETDLAELDLHVISGSCPIAAPAHAETGTWRSQLASTKARLVGFFAPDKAGVMTHHGTALHVHALVELDGKNDHWPRRPRSDPRALAGAAARLIGAAGWP